MVIGRPFRYCRKFSHLTIGRSGFDCAAQFTHRPISGSPAALLQANGVRLNRAEGSPLPADASLFEIVNEFERRTIMERLEKCGWSQTEAAESLHVPLSTLNQKIKRLDIKIRKKSDG
jgi:DNA-binding NtrC family response regulator